VAGKRRIVAVDSYNPEKLAEQNVDFRRFQWTTCDMRFSQPTEVPPIAALRADRARFFDYLRLCSRPYTLST
jgi:hypothetical protein